MAQPLESVSQTEFTQLVNSALKNYHSVLALARSPLADSTLVAPLLVLDDVSPTADERGRALRLVLAWAVNRLAPDAVTYPLGSDRPYDDPTWRNSHWWRYNILRHRYLEPLHPDEFVEGGRFTETIMALTGISTPDTFFDERNRAIREVAQWLQQQLASSAANEELQQLALAEVVRPLLTQTAARTLLGMAATFTDVFPRTHLLQLAQKEQLLRSEQALDYLTKQRFLLSGDDAANLWLSPVLRTYIYLREPLHQRRSRHLLVADYFRAEGAPLNAAHHLQQAQQWETAVRLLLDQADELINELQGEELCTHLLALTAEQLPAELACTAFILVSDLHRRAGRSEEAIGACRQALKVTTVANQQARIYWRMGKLYEKRNQLHALGYYQQAMARFAPDDTGQVELLKDRAWLHILRQEWESAQSDLTLALKLALPNAREQRANILDALAHLHLEQRQPDPAIAYARQALLLREEVGDLLQIARSLINLGNFYNRLGEAEQAIVTHAEAIGLCQKLNNQELLAEALLNQGVVYHLAGQRQEAIDRYQKSLAISQNLRLRLAEIKAHSNLAEAFAEAQQIEAARRHWQIGDTLSRQDGFTDQINYFQSLLTAFPLLRTTTILPATPLPALPPLAIMASPEERAILTLLQQEGRMTAKRLMAAVHISKATATRRLADLVARGVLARCGQGRGAFYVLATGQQETPLPTADRQITMNADAILARIHQTIHQQRQQLFAEYDLVALVVAEVIAAEPPLVQLVARFANLPNLVRFFALEQELETLCGLRVDLILEKRLSPSLRQSADAQLEWML